MMPNNSKSVWGWVSAIFCPIVCCCYGLSETVQAQEVPSWFMADLTYASKYMTDGFKVGGDHPVWEPSAGLNFGTTGLSASFWSAFQQDRTNRGFDEVDLFLNYDHTFFKEKRYAVNLHGFYDYWMFPNNEVMTDWYGESIELPRRQGNKLHAGVSLTELLPVAGSHLVPTYNAYYLVYWAQNREDLYQGGARHEVMLSYYHDIPKLIPGSKWHFVGVSGTVNYNDGIFNVHPGFSHSTMKVSTGVSLLGFELSASLNKQWSLEKSGRFNNEAWTTLSLTKKL